MAWVVDFHKFSAASAGTGDSLKDVHPTTDHSTLLHGPSEPGFSNGFNARFGLTHILGVGISMRSLILTLAILGLGYSSVDAAVITFYQENFDDDSGEGVIGPVPPNPAIAVDDAGNWTIDASGATLRNANDFAMVNGSSFQFRDLAGANPGGVAGPGQAIFSIAPVAFNVGSPAAFTFLNMTLNATVSSVSAAIAGDLIIESNINGNLITDTIDTTGAFNITHMLQPFLVAGLNNYSLTITSNMDAVSFSTATLDNILVEGNATPEPASMAMMGMGLMGMCGIGYRRRRSTPTIVD